MTTPTAPVAGSAAVEEIADLAADLHGIHPGLDLIARGTRLIAADSGLTQDTTQTLLAYLAGGVHGNPDVLGLLAALVKHLGDPDSNPALHGLPADRAAAARDYTAQYAAYDTDFAPRELCAEAAAAIDGT
ncbi:MAG TPA: hypothetical protein VFY14_20260 [Streptomyces sp.]|nr:hypothetical protein [Streptomyces sp.]